MNVTSGGGGVGGSAYLCGEFPAEPLGRRQRAVHLSFAVSVLGVAQLEGVCGQRVLGNYGMAFTRVTHKPTMKAEG